jgi:hypothetical protein
MRTPATPTAMRHSPAITNAVTALLEIGAATPATSPDRDVSDGDGDGRAAGV